MNLNEKQLNELFKAGVFPIYIYWDSEQKQFIYSAEKKVEYIGIIYKNPIPVKKKIASVSYTISLEKAKRIKEIIVYVGGVEECDVVPNADLFDNLGFDSLDSTELIMKIEKEFLISISDSEGEKIHNVSDIYGIVAKKLAEKQ